MYTYITIPIKNPLFQNGVAVADESQQRRVTHQGPADGHALLLPASAGDFVSFECFREFWGLREF